MALLLLGLAYQKFGTAIEEQQEIVAEIADVMMAAFALESSVLRAMKNNGSGKGVARGYCELIARHSWGVIEQAATEVIALCSEGDERRTTLMLLRKLTRRDMTDTISVRRAVARTLLDAGRYIV